MQTSIAERTKRPTSINVTQPLGAPIPKDKTVAFMTCSLASCNSIAEFANQAADALGWDFRKIDIGRTPETVKNGYKRAVDVQPDVVMSTGFGPELFGPELQQLAAMDIPVLLASVSGKAGEGVNEGVTAIYLGDAEARKQGAMQAEWVIAHEGTEAHSLVIELPGIKTIATWAEGFKHRYKELCPDCELGSVTIQSTDIGTPAVANAVVSYVQQNPDVNWVNMATSEIASGLPAALKNAPTQPKIGVLSPNPTVRNYIERGEAAVGTAYDWPTTVWKMFDTALRVFTDQPIEPDTSAPSPVWYVTKDNVSQISAEGYFPIVKDYQAQFKQLWGLA